MRSPTLSPALEVDFLRHSVRVDGMPIDLTATEYGILAALARDQGVTVSRTALLDLVWGPGFAGEEYLVDALVAHLRRKLGDDGRSSIVETVGAIGYRLAPIS